MATFNELLQKYVNYDYADLVKVGSKAMSDLLPFCKQIDAENNGFMMLTSIVLAAVGADGKLTALERKFLRDTTGMNDDTISNYIKMYDSRMADLVDSVADRFGGDVKTNIIVASICIAACDETISREETAYLHKLLD